jgi:hypothetical protein
LGVKNSFNRQASLAAEKKETSKQLKVALAEGELGLQAAPSPGTINAACLKERSPRVVDR